MTLGLCRPVNASVHRVCRWPSLKRRSRLEMSRAACFACALPARLEARSTSFGKHCKRWRDSHEASSTKASTSDAMQQDTSLRQEFGMWRTVGIADGSKSSSFGQRDGHGDVSGVRTCAGPAACEDPGAGTMCTSSDVCWAIGGAPWHWQMPPSLWRVRHVPHTACFNKRRVA